MTATYSNAMLVAILSHVSDCARQLDMPIPQPVTVNHVRRFNPSPYKDFVGGGLWLTNQYWFVFNDGFVHGYRCPDDYFTMADENWDNLERYVGVDIAPTHTLGPYENKRLGHIPYFRAEWSSPKARSRAEFDRGYRIQFDISLQQKRVVGMSLMSKRFFRPDPKVDVVPELESDYQKQKQVHLFVRTNAPPHWPLDQVTNAPPAMPPLGEKKTVL